MESADIAAVRLRLDLGYDGTDFSGWATQPGLRTVQGEIEAALVILLRTPNVRLTVGGRTDAGVHARGQVAHLDVTAEQFAKWSRDRKSAAAVPATEQAETASLVGQDNELETLLRTRRLRGVLRRSAPDIAIHRVSVAPAGFDARFGALRRRYEYRVRDASSLLDPLSARFTAATSDTLDLAAMQAASDDLLGLNDFTTFCKARDGATAVRELLEFDWRKSEDGALVARISADAFCHSMVRALVGGVVAVGAGTLQLSELSELRHRRERSNRFPVMPAHGLSLEEIRYPADHELLDRATLTRARREPLP